MQFVKCAKPDKWDVSIWSRLQSDKRRETRESRDNLSDGLCSEERRKKMLLSMLDGFPAFLFNFNDSFED